MEIQAANSKTFWFWVEGVDNPFLGGIRIDITFRQNYFQMLNICRHAVLTKVYQERGLFLYEEQEHGTPRHMSWIKER